MINMIFCMLNIALKTRPVKFGHYVRRIQFNDMESRILDYFIFCSNSKHSNLRIKIILSINLAAGSLIAVYIAGSEIVSYDNISRSIVSLWRLALKKWIVRRTYSRSAIKTKVTYLNTHVPQIQAGEPLNLF